MSNGLVRIVKGPVPAAGLILASAAVLAWTGLGPNSRDDRRSEPAGDRIFMTEALEANKAATLTDWAALADVVAQVSVTGEKRVDLGDSSADTEPVGRTVTLRVNEVLWSTPSGEHKLPADDIELTTYGWMQMPDGDTLEMASRGASRLEIDHDYLVALRWQPGRCADGTNGHPSWTMVGSGAVLPADGGVVGRGEFEGSVADRTGPELARSFPGQKSPSVTRELAKLGDVKRRGMSSSPAGCDA